MSGTEVSGTVAIIPWGDVIEDYLEPIGLTVSDMARDMSGGWLFGYVEALRTAGWRSIILAPSSSVQGPKRLEHAATGAPIWLVPGRSSQSLVNPELRALRQWRTTPLAAFRRVIRKEGCLALMVQDYERPQFDALVVLGRSMRLPVLATFQGGDRTLSRLEQAVRRWTLARAAGLIVASSAERERLAVDHQVTTDSMAAIPNPLDIRAWHPIPRSEARASLNLDRHEFLAVTHGRIDIERKGLDLLLEAWTGPGQLMLIGSGQDRERFAAMVRNRTDVRWIDSYTNDRELIRRWLCAADLYISASRLEGMPVAPLEAMACGLPVVASNAKGLEDIISGEGVGLLFPNGDAAALAAAINRLRDDPPLRLELGGRGRALVERRFSIPVVGRQLADCIGRTG